MATFRSRGRTPARRSSSSITVRTPAPACIRISGSRTSSAELDGAAGEAVAGRYGQHHAVAQERLVDEGAVRSGGTDHAQLELARQHPVDHR